MAEERYTSRHTGQQIDDAVDAVGNKADVINIGGAKRLSLSQAPLVNLYNIEPISSCTSNNKLWYCTDGKLYYRTNGSINADGKDYDMGTPQYMVYYHGDNTYKWTGRAFSQIGGSGGGGTSDYPPAGGIPATDLAGNIPAEKLASAVQAALALAASAYQKPSGGIPASDLAEAILTSLGKADTAYQKPSGGIPNNDLAGSIAYTKLAGSIPKTKLATAVQTSLGKADTAVQPTALTDLFASIVYDQTTHRFNFYGKGDTSHTTPLAYIDASQLSGIADDLVTDDGTIALSAAQGVLLKSAIEQVQANIQRLYDNLGNVAFWDAAAKASAEPVDISWDGEPQNPYQVPEGGEMVFWLDGKDLEANPTHWIDKIGGVDFLNSGGTLIKDANNNPIGMKFNGSSQRMTSANDLPFSPATHTIEVVCKPTTLSADKYIHIFTSGLIPANGGGTTNCIHAILRKNSSTDIYMNGVFVDGTGTIDQNNRWTGGHIWKVPFNVNDKLIISANRYRAIKNGALMESAGVNHWTTLNGGSSIGASSSPISAGYLYSGVEIYAIRIHRGFLTAAQMLANQKIDNERYGLGLTLPDSVS